MKPITYISVIAATLGCLALGGFAVWQAWPSRDLGSTLAGLVEQLRSADARQRCDSATALGQIVGPGAERVVSPLIEAVRDPDAQVRTRAARSLGLILEHNPHVSKFDAGIDSLTIALRDRNASVRATAAGGLWAVRRDLPGMLDAAVEALKNGEPSLQAESAEVLAGLSIRDPNEVRALLGLLEDPSPTVRSAGRAALVRPTAILPPDIVLPALQEVVSGGSIAAREVAAIMLGRSVVRIAPNRDMLIRLLRDETSSVRLAAAAAMGAFSEDTIARLALRLATDDPDLRVRATAAASLAIGRRATRAEALADLNVALESDPTRRDLVAEIQQNPRAAAARLVNALHDRNPRVKAAAARCLGEVASHADDPKLVIHELTISLTDVDPFVRRASAAALARFGPAASGAVAALQGAMRDVDRGVSGQALLSIKELETSRVK